MTTPLTPDWAPFLRKIALFSQFEEEAMARLQKHFHSRPVPAGTTLFRQGDASDTLFVLLSGQVRLSQIENDHERLVALLGRRGDTIGEVSLLSGRARNVTAHVDKDAELLVLERRDFEKMLRADPQLALPIARQLSEQLSQTTPFGTGKKAPPRRLYVLFNPLAGADRAVLTLNLGISLLEQSRRRILIVDIADHVEHRLSRALGLGNGPTEPLRVEHLQSPEALAPRICHHASGLEILPLPRDLLDEELFPGLFGLLNALRRGWDHVVVAVGGGLSNATRLIAEEADRVLVAWPEGPGGPESTAGRLWRELEPLIPAPQLDRVELQITGPVRRNRPGHFKIPWRSGFGQRCLSLGRPFIPGDAGDTHRALDRMARHLTGLRVGIAMGSGACLGYSIIGILRVLERNGIYPDLISGTSMGALIGSFYALGHGPDELERIALSITKMKLWSMIDFTLPWQGVIQGGEVLSFLKSILGDASFDDLALPFACVATDIDTGEGRVLRHGAVAEAVRASVSLPFFFQPFFHQGRYMVDGGLVDPVPSSVIKAMGADFRIGINITSKPASKRSPGFKSRRSPLERFIVPNVFRVMMKTIYTMQYGIAQTRAHDAHVVLAPDLSAFTWSEFHRAREIIRVGEENAEQMLNRIKAFLPYHADQCRVPLRPAVRPF